MDINIKLSINRSSILSNVIAVSTNARSVLPIIINKADIWLKSNDSVSTNELLSNHIENI